MEIKQRDRVWSLKYNQGDPESDKKTQILADELGVSELFAILLRNRGYDDPVSATAFLRNEESVLHDPFLLKDIAPAVERIRRAVENREKIVIYGDYDVDGVTSVSMLYLYLGSKGADVSYYIPSRSAEGYGLSMPAVARLAEEGAELIITVDTGITACEEVEYAKSLGIDMVITDHHECRPELPLACAVVNPHRPDCEYPFKELAGVGVVFKCVCAYEMTLSRENGEKAIDALRRICDRYADLAAIGTIADVMPIKDENRLIVAKGLKLVDETERPGLRALIEAISAGNNLTKSASSITHVKKKKITSGFVGFGIAPRINAAGRISTASKAADLLLAESDDTARELAYELCEINRARQVEENRIAEQAYVKIEESFDPENDKILVLDDDGWHQGIIGIVASRITEKYGLPSILITFDGATRGYPSDDDIGKGSGRSVKGINLVEAMNSCSDILMKYGGHELAAGLSLKRSDIPELRRRLNEYVKTNMSEDSVNIDIEADAVIKFNEINLDIANELYFLEPYGISNPTPVFMLKDAVIQRIIPVGTGKHTKLILTDGENTVCAMYFGMQTSKFPFSVNERVDAMVNLDINDYMNVKTAQLIVQDMKRSQNALSQYSQEKARYAEISHGGEFLAEEDIIPSREDFALVYTLVRRETRAGKESFSAYELLTLVNINHSRTVNYSKLMYILKTFIELKICGVEEVENDVYRFDVYYNSSKTNIERSTVLRRLRQQCKNRR